MGVVSQAEAIVIEFEQPVDGDEVSRKLGEQTPPDLKISGAHRLAVGEQPQPDLVRYRLENGAVANVDINERVQELLAAEAIKLERSDRKSDRVRSINARSFLEDMYVDGQDVVFVLRVTAEGSVRPAEIAGLLGFDATAVNHRIRRIEVQWR